MEALRQVHIPHYKGLIIRKTYPELSELITKSLRYYTAAYPGAKYNDSKHVWTFPSGAQIYFGSLHHAKDKIKYQGKEFDFIGFDELTHFTWDEYSYLFSRNRPSGPGTRVYMRATGNPGGVGHAWVKRLFIDRDYRAGERAEDYCFIPAKVWDNPVLTRADPDYVRGLESLPERLRAAWLDGRWDVFEGQFFSEFDEDRHVLKPGEKREGAVRAFAAMDYGFDRLALLYLTEDSAGRLLVERELCRSGLTLGEAARAVEAFLQDVSLRPEYLVASPDLWNRRQDSGLSGVAVMLGSAKLPPLSRADDRRVAGWRLLREYLHGDDGCPSLRIHSQCSELISCMQGLLCDPHRPEDAASSPHALTHAPEALRYAVMSRLGTGESRESEHRTDFRFSVKGAWD
jgi:hypothetical protein